NHFTMSVFVELADCDPGALAKAVDALVEYHDALQTRFDHVDGTWCQDAAPNPTAVFRQCDLSGLDDAGQRAAIEEAAVGAQSGRDSGAGPMLWAILFPAEARRPRLFLTVHHLVVDGVSWRILLEDLETAYRQLGSGGPVDLGPKTTSYRQWARL